jgi:prevent-host-death family protein
VLTVNLREAKSNLSRLVDLVESGAEAEIIIARNGKPAARLLPIASSGKRKRRLGHLVGHYPATSQEELDSSNGFIARLFRGGA